VNNATFSGSIVPIDLARPDHAAAIVELLEEYSHDPAGNLVPLPEDVRLNLAPRLSQVAHFRGLFALQGDRFVGLATCFINFSTFAARPLLNLHDLVVAQASRGQGVGSALLDAVEQLARTEDCAFVTLEVRADNPGAQKLYLRHSFDPGMPDRDAHGYWKKKLV